MTGSVTRKQTIIVGLVTIVVAVVAVVIAYNANYGIPFAQSKHLNVEIPSGARLIVGDDVKIGGTRIGRVADIKLRQLADGQSIAVLQLDLNEDTKPIDRDAIVTVRQRTMLGSKYVEIIRGGSKEHYKGGQTIPLNRSRPAVELDDILDVFNADRRKAAQTNIDGFSTALSQRGVDINLAIARLAPLMENAAPVLANLTSSKTQLNRFISGLGATMSELKPVANDAGELTNNLNRTFSALAGVSPQLQNTIVETDPTFKSIIGTLPRLTPFIKNTTRLARELQPGSQSLRSVGPALGTTATNGTKSLIEAPAFNAKLANLMYNVEDWGTDPLVQLGVDRLGQAARSLDPTLKYIAPAQLKCNYLALFFRNISSVLSQGGPTGTWQRFMILTAPTGPNNEGGPSYGPANGPGNDNHLHSSAYPYTAAPGQDPICEAGNELYTKGKTVIGHAPTKNAAGTESYTGSGG